MRNLIMDYHEYQYDDDNDEIRTYMYHCGHFNDGEVGDDSNNDDDDDEYILNKIYYLNRMRAPVMMYSRKVKQIPNVVRKTEPVHCTHQKIVIMIS